VRYRYYRPDWVVGSRIDFSNFPGTESAMDIQGWESLWKVFAIIGIANLFFLFSKAVEGTSDTATVRSNR
jgi:hypothetical protein